jgi:DNA-binding NtrC family response regulator
MARILISEPHDDVRRLLERMTTRLGHEPIAVRAPTPQQLTSADVFILEPAAPICAVLAQAAHLIDPTLPLICASVIAPPPELAELGISFTATLVKPFTLEQFAAALDRALRTRRTHRRDRRREDPDHGNRAA